MPTIRACCASARFIPAVRSRSAFRTGRMCGQRTITLARDGDGWRMLQNSKLIYVRLEADDSVRLAEPLFCAPCSRLALSLGVAEWIFALSEGLVGYSAAEYDRIAQLRW